MSTLKEKLDMQSSAYNVFKDFDAITRSLKIVNNSDEKINIERALSANVDFTTDEFDFVQPFF